MVDAFVIACFGLVFYAYLGYPFALVCYNVVRRQKPIARQTPAGLTLSVVIPVRNAAADIEAKLRNTLSMREHLQGSGITLVDIIVVSDASEDQTDQIVEAYLDHGITLLRLKQRGGKEKAQALGLGHSLGDVIVFTDVRARMQHNALELLAAYFADDSIGGVSTLDAITDSSAGEALYVRYEMWLRALESHALTLVGMSGSCFALRRSLCSTWHEDVPSDFFSALNAAREGNRCVLSDDVLCTYAAHRTAADEFPRKVRTILRGLTTLFRYRDLLSLRRTPSMAFQLVSHKLLRWLVPFLLLLGFGALLTLSGAISVVVPVTVGIYVLLLMAGIAHLIPELQRSLLFKVPLFFLMSNAAIVVAWYHFLRGKRVVTWDPTQASTEST